MVAQVVFDEGADEIVAMVVARMATQFQWLAHTGTGRFQQVRMQLNLQKLVGQPLVDEDAEPPRHLARNEPSPPFQLAAMTVVAFLCCILFRCQLGGAGQSAIVDPDHPTGARGRDRAGPCPAGKPAPHARAA